MRAATYYGQYSRKEKEVMCENGREIETLTGSSGRHVGKAVVMVLHDGGAVVW